MLHRRKVRTILGGVDVSEKTQTLNQKELDFPLLSTDYFYIGFHAKFASRYIVVKTANINATTITCEYWNGSSYEPVKDFIDQTFGITESGFISWVNESDWQKKIESPINDEELYWIRLKSSTNLSASTELEAVINLFSDDKILRAYYPDLVEDTRFLPPNRSDFLEQHETAKNLVVQRLKQKKVLEDESQIIDVNEVSVASMHACAAIILAPIAVSDQHKELLQDMRTQFERELDRVNLGIDLNKDGVVSSGERIVRVMNINRV